MTGSNESKNRLGTLLIGALLTAIVSLANPVEVSAQDKTADEIMNLARSSAVLAGAARYCKADPEKVEEYISKSEGRLTALARDEYEKVLTRLEFKNNLTAASALPPKLDCDTVLVQFDEALRDFQYQS